MLNIFQCLTKKLVNYSLVKYRNEIHNKFREYTTNSTKLRVLVEMLRMPMKPETTYLQEFTEKKNKN